MFSRVRNITSNLCKIVKPNVLILRSMATEEPDVIFKNVDRVGLAVLNRPKALNAVNLSMIKKLLPQLKTWEKEKVAVIIKGAGERAFCSGGDIRAIVLAGLKGDISLGKEFFGTEYIMNGLIGAYQIPYIALIDGITMGGGCGLSMHGQYRVATERTLLAMPETAIGLFSDVGASYFLNKLQGQLGMYLALTGYRLKGFDVLKAGLATHYMQSKDLDKLETDLLKICDAEEVKKLLDQYNVDEKREFSLTPHLKQIDECFSADTIEEILQRLEKDGSKWAQEQIAVMKKMSPTSCKLVLRELRVARGLSLPECLQMEFRLAVNCLLNKDFYEGVRAVLIDKDQKPAWCPPELCAVSDDTIKKYFEAVPGEPNFKSKL